MTTKSLVFRAVAVSASLLASAGLVIGLNPGVGATTSAPGNTLQLSSSTVVVEAPFTASGRLPLRKATKVNLEARIGNKWKVMASGQTSKTGAFSLSAMAPSTPGVLKVRAVALKVKIKIKKGKKGKVIKRVRAVSSPVRTLTVTAKPTATPTATVRPTSTATATATATPRR